MTKMTLIEALEKLALIKKTGLDTLIQLPDSTSKPITISDAIKAIKNEAIDTTDDYIISGEGIRKVGDDGYLGDIVYQVKEEN